MFSIPEVSYVGYKRGLIAMGIPGSLNTMLNIHQMGNNAITKKITAKNQLINEPNENFILRILIIFIANPFSLYGAA